MGVGSDGGSMGDCSDGGSMGDDGDGGSDRLVVGQCAQQEEGESVHM